MASFWCVLHNFYKVKFILDQASQIKLAACATFLACTPSLFYLMRSPNPKQFLLALFSVSMAFYLFSFHVHEKQILLPTLFFGVLIHEFRHFFSLFVATATFSMAKLFAMDKCHAVYPALLFGYQYFAKKVEACMVNGYKIGQTKSGLLLYNESFKIVS